jgi:hypothetical protein
MDTHPRGRSLATAAPGCGQRAGLGACGRPCGRRKRRPQARPRGPDGQPCGLPTALSAFGCARCPQPRRRGTPGRGRRGTRAALRASPHNRVLPTTLGVRRAGRGGVPLPSAGRRGAKGALRTVGSAAGHALPPRVRLRGGPGTPQTPCQSDRLAPVAPRGRCRRSRCSRAWRGLREVGPGPARCRDVQRRGDRGQAARGIGCEVAGGITGRPAAAALGPPTSPKPAS